MTIQSRRRCSACRLTRCFSSGMRRERLVIVGRCRFTRKEMQGISCLLGGTESRNTPFETRQSPFYGSPSSTITCIEYRRCTFRILHYPKISVFLFQLTSILDQELSLFNECLQGNSIQPKKALMSIEDLQRVESIEHLYNKRIELGKTPLLHSLIVTFLLSCFSS